MLVAWTNPGNAGSPNLAGERAAWTIAAGRQSVANLIGASPAEITFTSGTTEANNLAIVGAARRDEPNRNRIIVHGSNISLESQFRSRFSSGTAKSCQLQANIRSLFLSRATAGLFAGGIADHDNGLPSDRPR
ncbi:aminotransferase class V-fold PLP-dependent enzyme [Rhizobium tibeticum]|uniref:aminotransferase class V-fold PLP-dependent enzyme n=1 Tax=Rhizobium tibeticum TaxID=501024 RepID=UPI0035227E9A